MKAAYLTAIAKEAPIQVGEQPMPTLTPHAVLVRVQAVAVNRVDTYIRSGAYATATPQPFVVGRDAVGEVVAVGAAVSHLHVGDVVWTNSMGYAGRQGVTSEYAAWPAERVFPAPSGVDLVTLAASLHPATTAMLLLEQVHAGERLLVCGAGGHVGWRLVKIANDRHLTVVTTSSPRDQKRLRQLGATETLTYGEHFAEALSDDPGFDWVVDTSGQVPLTTQIALARKHGTILLMAAPKGAVPDFPVWAFYTAMKTLTGFVLSEMDLATIQRASQKVNQDFQSGALLEEDPLVMPVAAIETAYARVGDGSDKRRIVLTW